MNSAFGYSRMEADVVVAGFGSPHGDDEAGWQVIESLRIRPNLTARLVKITEGTQLIDEVKGCRRLILVDACRGGQPVGTVTRLAWPDARIRKYHNHSTHSVGLCDALQLAEQLQRVPRSVEVFGIEISEYQPLDGMSDVVEKAVSKLAERIYSKLQEEPHARATVG